MIDFFSENVALPDLDYKKIKEWIHSVAVSHGFAVGNLSYCFCDDPYILAVNRQFLNHDYYTDIITFDYTRHYRPSGLPCGDNTGKLPGAGARECAAENRGEPREKGRIGGDIVISLDTVRSNAELLGLPYDRELLRVIIHGVLHLCGIDDKGPGEREIMEACENEALALLPE